MAKVKAPQRPLTSKGVQITEEMKGNSIEGLSSGYCWIDNVSAVPNVLFPFGAVTEVMGLKSTGKTTLVIESLGRYQKTDNSRKILYCDFEGTIMKQIPYVNGLGLDVMDPNFDYQQFSTMQDGGKFILDVIRKRQLEYASIVIDTVAAMRPAQELENDFGETKQGGIRAKLMGELLRNLTADLLPNGPAVIFINQLYEKIDFGGKAGPAYMPKQYDSTASNALKYYAAVRYELKLKERIKSTYYDSILFKDVETFVGNVVEIFGEKNKVGLPYRKTTFHVMQGTGIQYIPTLFEAGKNQGVIIVQGNNSIFSVKMPDGTVSKTYQGSETFIDALSEDIELQKAVAKPLGEIWEWQVTASIKEGAPTVGGTELESEDPSEEI